jgi:hypothetical protein
MSRAIGPEHVCLINAPTMVSSRALEGEKSQQSKAQRKEKQAQAKPRYAIHSTITFISLRAWGSGD